MLAILRSDCARFVSAAVVEQTIGHMKVDAFLPEEACVEVFTRAFESLRETEALIIDLRDNRGGMSTGVALLLSFMTTAGQRVNTIEFRSGEREETFTRDVGAAAYGLTRPVFVLTSQRTFLLEKSSRTTFRRTQTRPIQ